MTLDEGPLKAAIDSDIDKVISERFERTYVKNNRLYKTTTTRQYDNTGDYIDTSNTEFLIDVNPHPNCDTDDCCGECETSTEKQEFDEYGYYGENNPPLGDAGNLIPALERAMGVDRTAKIVS